MLEAMGKAGKPQPRGSILSLTGGETFFLMCNGYPVNDFMPLSKNRLKPDYKDAATFKKGDREIIIEKFSELSSSLGVSAKKLLIVSMGMLARNNYYRADGNIYPGVLIDLIDYWKYQGYPVSPRQMPTHEEQQRENERAENTIKRLKQILKHDLEAMESHLKWSGKGTGENKGEFYRINYISSYESKKNNYLEINFDIKFAAYMINAYLSHIPIVLLLHDNRDSNSFSIGYKIALHNSIDNNASAKTNSTLSVRSLLAEAPDIPTMDELEEKGRRDWKAQIKNKLEQALEKNKTAAPVISEWHYRDSRTGAAYTPEQAAGLFWEEYSRLMVDFTMADKADQEKRRALRAAEKEAAAEQEAQKRIAIEAAKELAKETKGKRGRPRKNPEKSPAEKTEKKRGRPRKNPEK